jgi:hypothetical protein
MAECWKCEGIGLLAGCFETSCCGIGCDPEDPEHSCAPTYCDICDGAGGWKEAQPTQGGG